MVKSLAEQWAEKLRDMRWMGWPSMTQTRQFSAEFLDALMFYICHQEHAVANCGKFLRLSRPFSVPRDITFYRTGGSTRTEATFRKAGRALGYDVYLVKGQFSSQMKGESPRLRDMALSQCAGMGPLRLSDVYIIRSNQSGAACSAVETIEAANVDGCRRLPLPVINAGDDEHPTQALVDLASLYREGNCTGNRHPLYELVLLVTGDVKHSRTVNSLCYLLGKFSQHKITILFCTHPELGPKKDMQGYLYRHGVNFEIREDFENCIREARVVYMTRIPREQFGNDEASKKLYQEARQKYVFRKEYLSLLQPHSFVLHPLPIDEDPAHTPAEIDPALHPLALGNHRQCGWGRQSLRGVLVRYIVLDLIEFGLQQLPEYGRSIWP